ncbi:sphingolipid long chain base-responsive protein lsp1 [Naviculisporaceae sp. PSN 640]
MSRKSTDSGIFAWYQQRSPLTNANRALSIRSSKSNRSSSGGGGLGGNNSQTTSPTTTSHHNPLSSLTRHGHGGGGGSKSGRGKGFSLSSLRGATQPELSKRLFRLIKTSNNLISSYESAGKERLSIATQLSEWGEQTGDEAISDISDKVGVILSELGEQEDNYAHAIDESRGVLKTIRNTEKSVQPSRDGRNKLVDEIGKLKSKEPESARLVVLEQELVRAEAENLVAEAQLRNITRQKLKEAYQAEFLATIERADKQIILARHGLRLLELLDDTPIVPGDTNPAYTQAPQARQILNDAEDDLRDWRLDLDKVLVGSGDGARRSGSEEREQGQGQDQDDTVVVGNNTAEPTTQAQPQSQQQQESPVAAGGNGNGNASVNPVIGV